MEKSKFIIWDPRDGEYPRRDFQEDIISDGILGRITEDNVYLKAYAEYPGKERPSDLKVGHRIRGVVFRLSGEKGVYDIYRVS